MYKIKFLIAIIILGIILSCSKISEKIEKKVDEKIDKTIEENMKQIDSSLHKSDIDSLKKLLKQLDTTFGDDKQNNAKRKK
jgi:regulatory protein YycI of two-component signal transduction system YycFG